MNKDLIVLFFFVISWFGLFGQKITGLVQDSNGIVLPNVAVSLKDIDNKTLLFVFTDKLGVFQLQLKEGILPEYIVVKKYGYEESSEKFSFNKIQYNFVIEKVTTLETVNLIGKPPAIKVKKDTTFFRIENFIDGTERKVEDILKKLPGITVSEKGEIEFKGQKVEKVLVDGDDFFNNNYTMGTKNISAKMLGSVEAIERYSENQVLKNLENSEKIALNLKLKKGENDFSKSATVGLGLRDKYYYNLNVIGVSYKFKTILTSSFNTIGVNESPYDFINSFYFDNPKELDYFIPKKINLPISLFDVKNNFLNQNQNFLNSINNLFKLNKTATIGLNIAYVQDKLNIHNTKEDIFLIENQIFTNNETNDIIKKPKIFNTTLSYLNNHKNLRIKIDGVYKNWNSEGELTSVFNDLNEINLLKSIENIYYLNGSLSTKLNENNALDFSSLISFYNGTEDLYFKQPKELNSINIDLQYVFSNKILLENKLTFIGKKNKLNYKFGLYQQLKKELLLSKMQGNTLNYNENKVINDNLRLGIIINLSFKINKLLLISENDFFTNKNIEQNNNYLRYNPKFKSLYTFSEKSKLGFEYSLESNNMSVNELYANYIFSDHHSLSNNISKFNFINNQAFEIKYNFSNFLKEYLINFNTRYTFNNTNLNSNFSFTDIYYLNTYFIDNKVFNNFDLNISYQKLFSKYLSKVKLAVNHSRFYSQSKYFGEYKENQFVQWQYKMSYLSVFKGFLNFGNDMKFTSNSFSNNIKYSIQNDFTIFFRMGKKHIIKFNNSFVLPDNHYVKNNIFIINFEYFYFHDKNSISLTINNLTNSKSLYRKDIDENSISTYSQKIVPIGFVLKYDF